MQAQATFVDQVLEAFEDAVASTDGLIARWYNIGGCEIQLLFAGHAMTAQICPAIEHLATQASGSPRLTVYIWDRGSTGVDLPPRPWQPDDLLPRGEIRGFNDGPVLAHFMGGVGSFSLLDLDQNRAVVWAPDSKRLPHHEKSFPLRTILHWWMPNCGSFLVHAGAVGRTSGGVLLAGKGGSGKSTSALATLHSDLLYAGDDYTLVSAGSPPYAHSLYSTGKVWTRDIHRLPELAGQYMLPEFPDSEKAILFLQQRYQQKLVAGFPLRAILMPRISNRKSTVLRETARSESLKALAPSTIYQLPVAGREVIAFVAGLAKQVPAYIIELGADVSDVPQVIDRLLNN